MKNSIRVSCAALAVAFLFSAVSLADHHEEGEKPKYTIKQVMKQANFPGKGLLHKIVKGEGTDEDKKQLLDMYISMIECTPPKGDEMSWQILTGNAAMAAAKVVVGRPGAEKELKAATNCKACHDKHKPKD